MREKLYITGYRSFELGIFKESDPKIQVIKNVLKKEIEQFLLEGGHWILVSGQLGVEYWAAEQVVELKRDYPELKLAVFLPFTDFGKNWQEKNQAALNKLLQQADYVGYVSKHPYKNSQQLRNHTDFILKHSDGALMIYDQEYPGKSQYFLKTAESYASKQAYDIFFVSMDDLQSSVDF